MPIYHKKQKNFFSIDSHHFNRIRTIGKTSIILLLLFFTSASVGQQRHVDSLSILFHKSSVDTTKCSLLSKITTAAYYVNRDLAKKMNDSLISFSKGKSDMYLGLGYRLKGTLSMLDGNYKKAEKEYFDAIKIFKDNNIPKYTTLIYSNLGTLYGRQKDLELSTKYYKKSIVLNDSLNIGYASINPCLNLGINYAQLHEYKTSNEFLIKALGYIDQFKKDNEFKKRNKVYAYFLLGDNYSKVLDYEKAEKHYLKALNIAKKIKENRSLSSVYSSLGYLYEVNYSDNKKALEYYKKSLTYTKLLGDKRVICQKLSNVALQQIYLNQYKQARKNLTESLLLADSIEAKDRQILSHLHLTHLSIKENKLSEANSHYNKAKRILGKSSKLEYKDRFLDIARAYNQVGDYKKAYANMSIYNTLVDSLYQKNAIEKVIEVETKYQTEKKEKENLQLKVEKTEQSQIIEKEKQLKWFLGIGLIASLATLGIFIFYFRKNQKQKKLIENLQKELHHRIKNNLSYVDLFITLAKGRFKDKAYQTKLNELQNRMHSMFQVHKMLFKKEDITFVNAKNYIDTLLENVQSSYSRTNVMIDNTIESNENLSSNIAFPVGLIVNEFVTNSYKYAFDNTNKGKINISLNSKNNIYYLNLKDNGKGLPENFDIKNLNSFGLEIIELLTKEYKGTFAIDGTNGVSMNITLPKQVA